MPATGRRAVAAPAGPVPPEALLKRERSTGLNTITGTAINEVAIRLVMEDFLVQGFVWTVPSVMRELGKILRSDSLFSCSRSLSVSPVRLNRFETVVPGRLIEPASFTKVSALGVEEQRVNVFIDLRDPPEVWRRLGDGFGVDVRIVLAERATALKAPAGAIFRHADGWGAFVVEGGRARVRAVTPGLRAGYDVEILSGLREGEEVVLHPTEKVVDGVRVTRR